MLHYFPEVGYGMFLNEKEAIAFAEKYVHSNEYQQYAHNHALDVQLDPADPEYVQNILGYAQDALMFSVLDDDLYDIRRIAHLDGRAHDEDGDETPSGVFFYAQKAGAITRGSNDLYENLDEMAEEFRKQFGKYLPNDFDFVGHLCLFCGAFCA